MMMMRTMRMMFMMIGRGGMSRSIGTEPQMELSPIATADRWTSDTETEPLVLQSLADQSSGSASWWKIAVIIPVGLLILLIAFVVWRARHSARAKRFQNGMLRRKLLSTLHYL